VGSSDGVCEPSGRLAVSHYAREENIMSKTSTLKPGQRLGAAVRETMRLDAWRMYLDDIPQTTIARELGVDRRTVSQLLKEQREEERAYLDAGHHYTDDFCAKHSQLRQTLTQSIRRLVNAWITEEERELALEAVIQAEHDASPAEAEGEDQLVEEETGGPRRRVSTERSLQERAGVLNMTTRAHTLRTTVPQEIAQLSRELRGSLRDEAEMLGLYAHGREQVATDYAIAQIRELMAEKSIPDNHVPIPVPSVESWPREWEPETPHYVDIGREMSKA
jgi:hypothetical protein